MEFKDITKGTEPDIITLRLGYDCGVRASEVLNIDLVTVKKSILHSKENNGGLWATSRIEIIGKGDSKRELLLPPDLCEQVMDYINKFRMKLNNDTGSLICSTSGDQIKDQKFASTVFSKAFKTAGLTRTNRQGYHRLRKSYGTNLVQDCYDNNTDPWVEVPRRLGHRSFQTTLRYIQFDALRNNRSRVLSELAMTSDKYKAIQNCYIQSHGT
jgi:site-specific recombinase XerD